jgi:hypothetical protein
MLLFHIFLLALILIQKFNIKIFKNSSFLAFTKLKDNVGFISNIFNKYKLKKLQKFISKVGEMSDKYLSLLIIINVLIIIFYILLNIYVNIELSSKLNEYVNIYNKFHLNKSTFLLLSLRGGPPSKGGVAPALPGVRVKALSRPIPVYLMSGVKRLPKFHYSSNANDIFNLNNLRNNLPKISEVFINKDLFDNDVKFKELDDKFANLFIFLIIFKVFILKKDYNRVVKILFENLSAIGVDIKKQIVFRNILKGLSQELSTDGVEVFTSRPKGGPSLPRRTRLGGGSPSQGGRATPHAALVMDRGYKYNTETDKQGFDFSLEYPLGNIQIEELFLELLEYSEKRSAIVNSKLWNKIIFILKSFYKFNLQDLNTIGEVHLNKLRNEFKLLGNVDKFKEATGRKYVGVVNRPKRPWTEHAYQKEFDLYLEICLSDLKKELVNWISNHNQVLLSDITNLTSVIEQVILNMNRDLANFIFESGETSVDYNQNPRIISKINRLNKESINEFISLRNRNIKILSDNIKDICLIKTLDSKFNKLDLLTSPLFKKIQDILNSDLSCSDKQISIEKTLVEYDVSFFKEHLDNSSNQFKLLNLEYVKLLQNLNRFLKFYLINKYANLIKMFNSDKDNKYALIILMILYLGNLRTISFVFKEMLNIIFNPGMDGINKTNLIFMIANKFIKIFNLIKPEKVSLIVEKLCSFNNLKNLIKNMPDIDKVSLGDTLFSIIFDRSEIFELKVIKSKLLTEIFVKVNPIYFNDLISCSISLTQLPMLVKPRNIIKDGEYFPYIIGNTNVLSLNECKVIKNKFTQRYETEGSDLFYQSIDFLNSIKFKINIPMLNFVIGE